METQRYAGICRVTLHSGLIRTVLVYACCPRALSGLAFIPDKSHLDYMINYLLTLPTELVDDKRQMFIQVKFHQVSCAK